MNKIYVKEIEDYLDYYRNHPNVFNLERRLLIENIVLPTLNRDDVYFDEEAYHRCIRFAERWYYELFPYQKFVYAFVFMYEKETDIPLFRTFIIIMGRGNGKDGFIMPLLNFLTTEYYGINNYDVEIVGNSEEQVQGSFNVIIDMFERNKAIMNKHFYWNKEYYINRKTRSRMKYNTSNAKTKDGKAPGAILLNEIHAYRDYKQINVHTSAIGKKHHGRIFIISSDGEVRDGPLDDYKTVSKGILKGEENILRYFPFICKMDDETLVDKPELWEQANPSLPFMPDLKNAIFTDYYEQKKLPSKRSEFYSKRMNIPMEEPRLTVASWDLILKASYSDVESKTERPLPDINGKKVVVGIDFADLNDFASIGFLMKEGEELIWRCRTWINKNGKDFKDIKFPFENKGCTGFQDFVVVDTPVIDENELLDWMEEEISKNNFEVTKIILDMYRFRLLKKAFQERQYSIESKDEPHGIVRMIRYPASLAAIFAPYIETMFIKQLINIGNSAMMRWAINNTSVNAKKDGNKTYEKIEPHLRKNDPFMAFVCAVSGHELLDELVVYI